MGGHLLVRPSGVPTARYQSSAGPRSRRFARLQGARAIEAYPITTTKVIEEELHVGTYSTFAVAGFTEVSRPTVRRVVMRIDF